MDICVFSSSYLCSGKVSIYSLTVGGVYYLVTTVVSPRLFQQQGWSLGDDVLVHLFDMDRSQSTVTNVDSSYRRRLSSQLQLCLVLFCKHPRRLHPHKFAFLQLKMSASEFHKTVCTPTSNRHHWHRFRVSLLILQFCVPEQSKIGRLLFTVLLIIEIQSSQCILNNIVSSVWVKVWFIF